MLEIVVCVCIGVVLSILCCVFLVRNIRTAIRTVSGVLTVLFFILAGVLFGSTFPAQRGLNSLIRRGVELVRPEVDRHFSSAGLENVSYSLDEMDSLTVRLNTILDGVKPSGFVRSFVYKTFADTIKKKISNNALLVRDFAQDGTVTADSVIDGFQRVGVRKMSSTVLYIRIGILIIAGLYVLFLVFSSAEGKRIQSRSTPNPG